MKLFGIISWFQFRPSICSIPFSLYPNVVPLVALIFHLKNTKKKLTKKKHTDKIYTIQRIQKWDIHRFKSNGNYQEEKIRPPVEVKSFFFCLNLEKKPMRNTFFCHIFITY